MIKKAKNETLADDDLRFLAEKELAARKAPSVEDIANMNFDERLAYSQKGFKESRDQQMNALDQFGQQQQDVYSKRIADTQAQMEAERSAREGQNAELLRAFEAEQRQAADMAKQEVAEAGREGMETLKRSAARRGMQRSSETEGAISKATANTQKLIQQIELATNSAVREYQVKLLDDLDKKMEKLQDRVTNLGDAAADAELSILREKQKTYVDLMSQDPSNPKNMIELADRLKAQQLEELKLNNEAAKELRKEAQANFQFMVGAFGSQAFANTTPEEMANLAANLGVPASVLLNMPATLKEQEAQWDKLKYYDTQDFQYNLKQMDYAQQNARDQLGFDMDIAKLQATLQKDLTLEQFKDDLATAKSQKERATLLEGLGRQYGNYASSGDKSGLYFPAPVPHPAGAGEVVSLNAKLAQAYPDGFRFKASDGPGGLGGQCKWFAQQLTQFTDGSGWLGGSTLADTKKNFEKYYKQGKAFKVGEQEVKPGMAVLSSDSKTYGHGYVINAIRPDGKWVVTESNYKGPLTVSNSRVVDPNDPKVIGVLKTVPKANYTMKGLDTLGKGLAAFVKNTPVGGVMSALGQMTQTNVGNEINRRVGQEYADQMAAANQPIQVEDWQVNAFNQLPAAQQQEVMRADPAFYQAIMQKGGGLEQASQTEIRQVRKEYNDIAKATNDSMQHANQLNTTWNAYTSGKIKDKGAVDNALIMLFSKMLDPGSVVREGEFDRVIAGQPLLTYAQNLVSSKATGGYALGDEQRKALIDLANEFATAQRDKMAYTKDFFTKEAEYLGVPADRIIGAYDFSVPQQGGAAGADPLGLGANDPLGLGI
jgi:hypothetical protein